MPNTFFMGYPTHLDFLAAIDRARPVNALVVITRSSGDAAIAIRTHHILLSQIDAAGHATHYLRLPVAKYQVWDFDGRPVDAKRDYTAIAQGAWKIVQTWLAEQGLTVVRAAIAFPADLRLLEGSADQLMEYSAEIGQWLFADRIDPCLLEPYQPAGLPAVAQGV